MYDAGVTNSEEIRLSLGKEENKFSIDYNNSSNDMTMAMSSPPTGVVTNSEGLIVPKKLINPCKESIERQSLHKELIFNQKSGKNVLNQKTELQKAFQKQKERQLIMQQKLQEEQQQSLSLEGELKHIIMQRAQRLEKKQTTSDDDENDSQLNLEYLNVKAKLKTVDAK